MPPSSPAFEAGEEGGTFYERAGIRGAGTATRPAGGIPDKARAGQGQVAFIAGEAESGKTALIRHFAMRAEGSHAALRQGNVAQGLTLAEAAVAKAQSGSNICAEGMAERYWAMALAALHPPGSDEAESHLAVSLARLEEEGALTEAARTRVVRGRLLQLRGNPERALEKDLSAATYKRYLSCTSSAQPAPWYVRPSRGVEVEPGAI